MATARDGCCVPCEPLAAMVTTFVRDWNRTRPPTHGQFENRGTSESRVPPVGPYEWLVQETGVSRGAIENVAAARSPLVELRVADRLVAALGRPEAFHDGTLPVMENPLASAKVRAKAECCGGAQNSLTGA